VGAGHAHHVPPKARFALNAQSSSAISKVFNQTSGRCSATHARWWLDAARAASQSVAGRCRREVWCLSRRGDRGHNSQTRAGKGRKRPGTCWPVGPHSISWDHKKDAFHRRISDVDMLRIFECAVFPLSESCTDAKISKSSVCLFEDTITPALQSLRWSCS